MTLELYYDPEDGEAQYEKVFESFDGAIEYLAKLKRKADEEAFRELIPDEEPMTEKEYQQVGIKT